MTNHATHNFQSAILIYTRNTITGWFSAIYKVAAMYDDGLAIEGVLRSEESFKILVGGAQDYFNQTNAKIYSGGDAYVNRFYHHYFAKTFGQELPCVFLELLFSFVLEVLGEVWLEDIHRASPPKAIWDSWERFTDYIKNRVLQRAVSNEAKVDARKIDLFVERCHLFSGCVCKGLTGRPYKADPFSVTPTMVHATK